ncbi:hypothetical protein chiPu_0005172 [Chiloscyllium punctatum]|uniref:Uncharacterized protein n=1 Tax=Chiloscyllium punctatum TaxID=137246 RepID=A0A401S8N6_CHIPU|nr:hypothetical protein [Chiloscyllium punctatum]
MREERGKAERGVPQDDLNLLASTENEVIVIFNAEGMRLVMDDEAGLSRSKGKGKGQSPSKDRDTRIRGIQRKPRKEVVATAEILGKTELLQLFLS